ncbi:MAG TPA: sigma-70 family RNA polymerase sigma factor [Sedimentisphaerales bacterium]|nr:sigma-70 family RNA polymerase sigma factor [Sedimentisphaerales bacterium]
MTETDQYYVERCLDGHPDDFRHLVRRYQPVLLAHLAGKLANRGAGFRNVRDSAEEAAQETLVRAYFKMDKLKKPESFFPWLLAIADNVAKEQQRKEIVRRRRQSVRECCEEAAPPELSEDYGLEAVVAGLPEAYRTVILLRYYGGQSCKQIAEQLEMPLGTVTVTLSRAYALLRSALQQKQGDPERNVPRPGPQEVNEVNR